MFERLHIQRFKSLRDTTVELAPLTVVFGPNAAGKSNLVEAMLLLARLVGERTLSEAFAEGIRGYPLEAFSLPSGGVEALLQQQHARIRLEAEMSEPAAPGSSRKPGLLSFWICSARTAVMKSSSRIWCASSRDPLRFASLWSSPVHRAAVTAGRSAN